jgi:hypothetical protein
MRNLTIDELESVCGGSANIARTPPSGPLVSSSGGNSISQFRFPFLLAGAEAGIGSLPTCDCGCDCCGNGDPGNDD